MPLLLCADVNPQDYSYWVEGKIVTEGETRLVENTLGLSR